MYTAIERQQMLATTHDAIQHGLNLGTQIVLEHRKFGPSLLEYKASFVTLRIDDLLRGCIGSLTPSDPLIEDIACNAYNAAFNDPRFNSLEPFELALLDTEISILSDTEKLEFSSEQQLLDLIEVNTDGLILRENTLCSTFLPVVWQQLPNPEDFLRQLKSKAGLDEDYWSTTLTVERYTVESYSNH